MNCNAINTWGGRRRNKRNSSFHICQPLIYFVMALEKKNAKDCWKENISWGREASGLSPAEALPGILHLKNIPVITEILQKPSLMFFWDHPYKICEEEWEFKWNSRSKVPLSSILPSCISCKSLIQVSEVVQRLLGLGLILPLGLWHIWIILASKTRLPAGSGEACGVSSNSLQAGSGSGGSWQTRSCTKALAFTSHGREWHGLLSLVMELLWGDYFSKVLKGTGRK